jgi:uncharacterized protein (DUF2236 family)
MSLALRPGTALLRDQLDKTRQGLADAVRHRIAGPEFNDAHQEIWFSPGARWFTEADPIWRIHADTSMFVGGIRALLLQSLHPVAMLGVSENSGFRSDPWGRLHRTSRFLATTTYGPIPDAERSIAIVRAVHGRVKGTTPSGEEYRADDPHLLGWIHAAEVDSFLTSYRYFGAKPLTDEDADTYVRQSGFVSAKLGVVDPPETVAELETLLAEYRPELCMSPPALDAADLLLKDPPLSGPPKLGYGLLAAGAVSILPPWARTAFSLPSLPATDRILTRPLARTALRTIRWALSGASTD